MLIQGLGEIVPFLLAEYYFFYSPGMYLCEILAKAYTLLNIEDSLIISILIFFPKVVIDRYLVLVIGFQDSLFNVLLQ